MSMAQLLETIDDALQDDAVGLSSKLIALAGGDARVRSNVKFEAWALSGTLTDARRPNVAVRPLAWEPDTKTSDVGHRDAAAQIEIGYECFDADLDAIQINVALAATAVAQVIDGLRAYSDAHQGTIIEVLDPVRYTFGDFAGATSHGFTATISLVERSNQ
jgi:hypothetical protein